MSREIFKNYQLLLWVVHFFGDVKLTLNGTARKEGVTNKPHIRVCLVPVHREVRGGPSTPHGVSTVSPTCLTSPSSPSALQMVFCTVFTSMAYFISSQVADWTRFVMFLSMCQLLSIMSESIGLFLGTTCNPVVRLR